MSFIIKQESSGNFTPAPAGNHPAVCIGLIDLGMQTKEYPGQPATINRELMVIWELPYEENPDDPNFAITVSKFYTVSLNEKANLYKDLISWRGCAFTNEELDGFELENILGVPCLLNVVQKTKQNGKVKAEITGITPMPKNMERPIPATKELIKFNMETSSREEYNALSNGIRGIIDRAHNKLQFDSRTLRPDSIGMHDDYPMTDELSPF